MWLVCRRPGVLTQGLAPDPKCKLNICETYSSLSIRLPHLRQGIMVVLLLLQVMGDGKVGGWFIYVRVWVGDRGRYCIFCVFCSAFVLLLIVLSWLVHDSLPVLLFFFFCFYLWSL